MNSSPRSILGTALAFLLVFLGLEAVARHPTGHEHGPIARARALGLGDPESKVLRLMGRPASVGSGALGETEETFEANGERVIVGIEDGHVAILRAVPDVQDPTSAFVMLGRRGIFPNQGPTYGH